METNHNRPRIPFKITGDWKTQSKQLKEKFSVLTDWDLLFTEGKERELIEKVGNRLRKNREEVIDLLKYMNLSSI
ncbi:hypothetical protein IW15_11335 [Chryseobacterium soli]|uniref:General stress protein CsbD n=1 Tax=Chryseobacterium soli TaxID=445961 RepID=A0A086A636_9FLAO|nr:hypothetical protein [Chryseobacterium soli]KFF12150.1 hypothetical protein IW15_11335 [Chryseobacterium soli]